MSFRLTKDFRFESAQEARQAAALDYVRERRGARAEGARSLYIAADRAVQQAQAEAMARVEKATGHRYVDTNYIFPHYILTQIPRGLCGLIIAVIFAAAMSTLSGELSSLATASMVDFYKRFLKTDGSEAHDLFMSRVFTGLWGVFAGFVALRAGQLGSAIEVVNRFGSWFYGSLLGVFLLAILAPRVRGRAASYSLGLGLVAVFAVYALTPVHFLWYNVVGAVTVFASGLALTALEGARR